MTSCFEIKTVAYMTIFYRVIVHRDYKTSRDISRSLTDRNLSAYLYRTNRELRRFSQHIFKALLTQDDAFLHIVKLLNVFKNA